MKNERFINWYLPLFMILAPYRIGIPLFGLYLLFFAAIFSVIYTKKFIIDKNLLLLIVYCLLVQMIFHDFSQIRSKTISLVSLIIPLIICGTFICQINEERLYKSFCIVGTIAMIALFIQAFTLYILKRPVFPIVFHDSFIERELWGGMYNGDRPCSFFPEPQAYASYIMPFLFLTLKRNNIILGILITLSVLLSTSTQGVIMCFILWLFYIVNNVKSLKIKFLYFAFLIFLSLFFFKINAFEYSRNKLVDSKLSVSSYIRVVQGFKLFEALDESSKWIGVGGASELSSYIQQSNSKFSSIDIYANNETGIFFTSGISGIFVHYGIIAGLLLIFMFVIYSIRMPRDNLPFLFVIIAMHFSESMRFNAGFIYVILFYLGISYSPSNKNFVRIKFSCKDIH